MKTPLVLRYFIGSMLIFAISMILLSFRVLRPIEMKSTSFTFARSYQSYLKSSKENDSPVLLLPIYEPMAQEMFLRVAKDIVHHLKRAGAKVVILPLKESVRLSPSVVKSVQEINRDSIAIFGVPASTAPDNTQYRPDDRSHWWVRRPLFPRTDVPWGVITDAPRDFSRLIPFVPTGYRDFDSGKPVPDIGVLALKRFFDFSDDAELPTTSSLLQVGAYTLPIAHDGLCYTKFQVSNKRWNELGASYAVGADSLQYFSTTVYGWTKTAIDSAWQAHKGKIVIIGWNGLSGAQIFPREWEYAQIINSVFTRTFVRVHNEWNVLLITTLVILLSVLSYTIRNGLILFISLILAAGAFAMSVWLFDAHDILFEPVYVMVAIVLSGCILPIVKISGEKMLAEEKIKSLEEENRRLSDLLRPPSAGSNT